MTTTKITDPRPYLNTTVRYEGALHNIIDFGAEMDEGEQRVWLITDKNTCLDLYWGMDYSEDFTIIS